MDDGAQRVLPVDATYGFVSRIASGPIQGSHLARLSIEGDDFHLMLAAQVLKYWALRKRVGDLSDPAPSPAGRGLVRRILVYKSHALAHVNQ